MMTAHGSEQIAVETMKLGADDYLTKPFHPKDVTALADKLIKDRAVRIENLRLREQIERAERYLAHLVDSVNEAIISTDSGGNILSFNNKGIKELKGTVLFIFPPPPLSPHLLNLFRNLIGLRAYP